MATADFIGPRHLKSIAVTQARLAAHRNLRVQFAHPLRRSYWTESEIDAEFIRVESALIDENRIAQMGSGRLAWPFN